MSGERNRPLGAPVAELGTADGGRREAPVEQAHPLGSVYNFYTWAEQLADFAEQATPPPPPPPPPPPIPPSQDR